MGDNQLKVVAFNGSARPAGNTAVLINEACKVLQRAGIETETVSLAGHTIRGCTACYSCFSAHNRQCAVQDDIVNSCIEKMLQADGIILASPTYFSDLSAELKALIDRAGMVARANGDMLRRKVGAAIVAVRRAGAIHTFDSINHFFLISQMLVPGSSYWNIGIGKAPGEVEHDDEGIKTMQILGENFAWALTKLKA